MPGHAPSFDNPGYHPQLQPADGPRSPMEPAVTDAAPEVHAATPGGPAPALDHVLDLRGKRMGGHISAEYDAGEEVVGSHTSFRVAAPRNADTAGRPANVTAAIVGGNNAFVMESQLPTVAAANAPGASLGVTFRPQVEGYGYGILQLQMEWPDGHRESVFITLHGIAHALGAPARSDQQVAPPTEAPHAPATPSETPHGDGPAELDRTTNIARSRLTLVEENMRLGVTSVRDEVASYKRAAEKESPWADLIELALSVGLAGVVGVLSHRFEEFLNEKHIEERLVGVVSSGERLKPEGIAAGVSRTYKEYAVTKGVAVKPNADIRAAATKAFEKLAEEGPKSAVAAARKRAEERTPGDPAAGPISSDVVLEFFNSQSEGVGAFALIARDMITNVKAELDPLVAGGGGRAAAEFMIALKDTYATSAGASGQLQAMQTSAAWMRYKARLELGTESSSGDQHPQAQLASARIHDDKSPINGAEMGEVRGLLEIQARRDDSGHVTVVGAKLLGFPRSTVARIRGMNIAAANVPFRVVMVDDAAVITVDEHRAIRVHGIVPGGSEREAIHAARDIVRTVAARSLAEWDVEIEDDDGSGRVVSR